MSGLAGLFLTFGATGESKDERGKGVGKRERGESEKER